MKKIAISLLLLVVVNLAAQNAPVEGAPVSIRISTQKNEFVSGTPVRIEVDLENLSDHEIRFGHSKSPKGENSYQVEVVSAMGASAPMTDYGKALHGLPTKKPIIISYSKEERVLQPHEKLTSEIALDTIYQLSPGQYFVQVRKQIPENIGLGVAVSNQLKFTVLPE